MKKLLLVLLSATMLQGCAVAGLAGLAAINKSGEETTVWAAKVERMNCSQMRTELTRLNGKHNILSSINPADNSGLKISTLKSTMIRRGCRMPA